jgi:branched-chain amino acid transport system substrate-binding protein
MNMLAAALDQAKSSEPAKIAAKLEGLKAEVFNGGQGFMRADDHQFFQPMYISNFGPLTSKEPFDEEKTGWGWKVLGKIDTQNTVVPTTCKMNRPS